GTGRKKRPYRWGQAGSRRYDLDTAGTTELSSNPTAAGSNPAGCTSRTPGQPRPNAGPAWGSPVPGARFAPLPAPCSPPSTPPPPPPPPQPRCPPAPAPQHP